MCQVNHIASTQQHTNHICRQLQDSEVLEAQVIFRLMMGY